MKATPNHRRKRQRIASLPSGKELRFTLQMATFPAWPHILINNEALLTLCKGSRAAVTHITKELGDSAHRGK